MPTAARFFLGFASCYAKFIPIFATLVAPMRECFKDQETFAWSEAAQDSFDNIKQLLVSSSALALYDASLHPCSVITTDTCDYGLVAVFAQIQPDGTEKPVAFASRTLKMTKCKFSVVEKEALACVWATEKFILIYAQTTRRLQLGLLPRE